MSEVRIDPQSPLPATAAIGGKLVGLLARSAAMGVLTGPTVIRVDAPVIRRLVKDLQRHGIGGAAAALSPLMQVETKPLDAATARAVEHQLDRLAEALEGSAAPSAEWPAMRNVFGDDPLAAWLDISPSSLRRYAGAERETPQATADRLHWLAMVVADLAGAYNDYGIRRWFDRPRAQLDGRSPRQLLGARWSPDDAAAGQVRQLAGRLSGAQPLAV
jgi:hypothetical protein